MYRSAPFVRVSLALLFVFTVTTARSQYLKQSLNRIPEADFQGSSKTAGYKPIFGAGDSNSKDIVKSVKHFGQLSIRPGGDTKSFAYSREELVYYVLGGTGMLHYENRDIPISRNDFFYVLAGTKHGFTNPREDSLNIMVMGVGIPPDSIIKPTIGLKIASANQVMFQLLPQNGHGPSSRYQLLVGTTSSKRDRLAAANQISSVYVIDFDPGGTNIPHRHKNEEEIYFMLQGNGEMVAGETAEGKEMRYPANAGDAFFFSPDTLVGFYSNNDNTKEHARILAIRIKSPRQ